MSSTYMNITNFNYNNDNDKTRYNIKPEGKAQQYHIPKDMIRTTFAYISEETELSCDESNKEVANV